MLLEQIKKVRFIRNIFNKRLQTIIFFVTSKCNSRCIGCFNWEDLNQNDDLSLEEILKTARKLPKIKHILFSGGEPTLREDLPEICKIFLDNNKIRSISIPTNGLMPKKISKIVGEILQKNPSLLIGLHFSLDGLEKTHDYLRGIKGNFMKVKETINEINKLKKKYPNQIDTSINTVISNKNYQEIPKLIKYVKRLGVGDHTFDFLRGNIQENKMINLPSLEEIKRIRNLRIKTKKHYLKNKGLFHRIFSLLKEIYLVDTQIKVLQNKKWGLKCLAGEVAGVINHRGEIFFCELKPKIGNLRNEDYQFKKIWNGMPAKKQRDEIKNHVCDCTHTCFLSNSIDHSPKIVFWKMILNYLF
jgi:MoaA/NifB/PqqE/SkfB family radical SAM enzyme